MKTSPDRNDFSGGRTRNCELIDMEWITLGLFCAGLLLCIVLDFSILYALAAGLVIFMLYGRHKGFSWGEVVEMALSGVKSVKNILITFVLIGMLTALWRDAGTIPAIVCYAAQLIRPSIFLLMAFWLNCGVSVLTGTAFGTAATMGVICATIAATMGIDVVLVGGAVLSGAYFGDRCSPVSTSALLVSELTGTNIFRNIRGMVKTALVPFLLASGLFLLLGMSTSHSGQLPDLRALFGREFVLSWVALLPAVVILVLSAFQVKVKIAMTVSILTALPISLLLQGTAPVELPALLLTGYRAADAELAGMINGGGITSMLRVGCIVCLSSTYSGIFKKTGLLDQAREMIAAIARRTNPYTATLCTSAVASMVACNQSLSILLTNQLCDGLEPDREKFALDLENTAVVVAPLVPWSIAGGVVLSTIDAPTSSILMTFFLYLLPLWRLAVECVHSRQRQKTR